MADGSQVQVRQYDENNHGVDTAYTYHPDGIYVSDAREREGNSAASCSFDPPGLSIPWPISTGRTFSSKGDCGTFALTLDSHVDSARRVNIGGVPVDVFVIATVVSTHGSIESTGRETDFFAPSIGLPVHIESEQRATSGTPYEKQLTLDLMSAEPDCSKSPVACGLEPREGPPR